MGSILISLPRRQNSEQLREIIRQSGLWEDILICRNGSEVLSKVEDSSVSLVICTAKFSDMGYEELNSLLPDYVKMLLLTKDEAMQPFSGNIYKLLMPFRADTLIGALKTILPGEYGKKPEKKKKLRSPEEQKTIDDAKKKLMENKDMTEPEAFRYLQKISMDTGRSLVETAQMVEMMKF